MALTKLNTHGIGADVILAEDIAANAVTVSEIQDDAVTQAKVADQAIDEARMQISNAGSNGQFLSKQSGNTGGLTWADGSAGWQATTEGLVTTTSGQDNIDFTIPADVTLIKVMFYGLSQVSNSHEFEIRIGTTDGTVHTSGYMNTSWYSWHTAAGNLYEDTDGIYLRGWNATANYWYGSLNMESVGMDGRRWFYSWNPYNDTYGEYNIGGNGRLALNSGQQIRKIRFTSAGGDGYDAGCLIKVLTQTV